MAPTHGFVFGISEIWSQTVEIYLFIVWTELTCQLAFDTSKAGKYVLRMISFRASVCV